MRKKKKVIKRKSKGLGDSIEKITRATGIKKAVSFLLGEDCGCKERQEWLNKLVPYGNVKCLTEEEYWYLDDFYTNDNGKITYVQGTMLAKIHKRVFSIRKQSDCKCSYTRFSKELKKVYNAYLIK